MVLQDYGAAMPAAEEPSQPARKSTGWKYGAVAAVCVGSLAMVLLVSSAPVERTALLQTDLSQHLMSQFSRDSTNSDSDEFGSDTMSLSDSSSHDGSNWYGNWGHSHSLNGNAAVKSTNKWEAQLQKLQAGEKARREEEDKEFFSGVDKAFGKKTGAAMMAAFNGKSKTSLSKMKLDDKKLKEQKEALAKNTKLPNTKAKADDVKKAVKAAATKSKAAAAAPKKSKEEAAKSKEEASKHAAAHKKAHADAVKEALKVAKQMDAHKDPVAKTEKPKADAKKEVEKKKTESLKHTGVIGDGNKIKQLVHEFKHAHGKKKKELKARVQSLEQQIKDDFNRVTSFGHRAQTKFAREEKKASHSKN